MPPAPKVYNKALPKWYKRETNARIPIVEKPLLGNALLDKIRDVGSKHQVTR